jgi:carboxylesterase type B
VAADIPKMLNYYWGNNATANALILGAYPAVSFPGPVDQFVAMFTDFVMACSMKRALLAQASASGSTGTSNYNYLFTYRGADNTSIPYHGAEMNLMWGAGLTTASDVEMSNSFQQYWSSFVRRMDSNPPGAPVNLPTWSPFVQSDGHYFSRIMDVPLRSAIDVSRSRCEMWNGLAEYVPTVPT